MADALEIVKRLQTLKSARSALEPIWRDCYSVTNPIRAHGLSGEVMDAARISSSGAKIMDGVTADACRTLVSQIVSGLHPSNAQWAELEVFNAGADGKLWLAEAAELLYQNIHASNFDSEAFEAIYDAVVAGWFVLYIDEDRERGGLTFQQWPIGGCYISSTRADGQIDTIIREYKLTANQCVSEFGIDKVSEKVRGMVTGKRGDENVLLAMQIAPRKNASSVIRSALDMPFEAVTVEVDNKHICRESGYHEFPCVIPRMTRIPESFYGVGLILDALPDSLMLNAMKKFHLANAELNIAGMWIAEDDGVLNARSIKVGPRKIIVANSVDSMKPLNPPGNWQLAQEEIKLTQASIRKILMADQLQPQDGPAMTATEVHIRQGMVRQLLGPLLGRFQPEYLQRLIERVFGILFRAGVFRDPPESLSGKEYRVKYISPIARAQKMEDVGSIERMMNSLGAIEGISPDAADNIDTDAVIRTIADGLGVPAEILRKPENVQEIRNNRAEQQRQQQQAAMMEQMAARAAPQIAQGLMSAK